MTCLSHRITTGTPYTKPPKPDRWSFAASADSASLSEVVEEEEEEAREGVEKIRLETKEKENDSLVLIRPKSDLKIKLLPLGTVGQLPRKEKLVNSFDLIYLSASQVSYLTPELTKLLKDDANLVVENVKYMPPVTKEQEAVFLPKVTALATAARCEVLGVNDLTNNNFHLSFHRVD